MTNELLDKYLTGSCTEEEKEEVRQWLGQQDRAAMDNVLYSRWERGSDEMPVAETQQLWQNLWQQLPVSAPVISIAPYNTVSIWARRITVAAVLLLTVATTVLWYRYQPAAGDDARLVASRPAGKPMTEEWIEQINDQSSRKEILLEDGTVAVLEKNGAIRYRKGFEPQQRQIQLKGTAFFKVASDKRRPLSVHSGDIITTALGTAFTVRYMSEASPVVVQLHEGKVKVHKVAVDARKEQDVVYLLPGQQCRYSKADGQMLVSTFEKHRVPAAAVTQDWADDVNADTMLFTNKPLNIVLQQLQERYHTTIQYDNKEIVDIYFTGKVVKTDSLEMVLRVIAQMNALQLSQQEGIYKLSK